MNRIIGIFLICIISLGSFAQKCQEVIDPITGEGTYEFEFIYTIMHATYPNYQFKYMAKDGAVTLAKGFYFPNIMKTTAPAGTEVFFKLKSGEIITLKTIKECAPRMYTGFGPVFLSAYDYVFSLNKETLGKLAESPVVLMRVPKLSEEGYVDLDEKKDVIKKNAKPLMKAAACICAYLK